MSRTPARFTQADVARALRALQQSGYPGVLEILPNGTIRIVPISHADLRAPTETPEVEPVDL